MKSQKEKKSATKKTVRRKSSSAPRVATRAKADYRFHPDEQHALAGAVAQAVGMLTKTVLGNVHKKLWTTRWSGVDIDLLRRIFSGYAEKAKVSEALRKAVTQSLATDGGVSAEDGGGGTGSSIPP
jgi:hypothetical protein